MIYKMLHLSIKHLHEYDQEWNRNIWNMRITQKKLSERFNDDLFIVYQNEPGWNSLLSPPPPSYYIWRSKR